VEIRKRKRGRKRGDDVPQWQRRRGKEGKVELRNMSTRLKERFRGEGYAAELGSTKKDIQSQGRVKDQSKGEGK